MACEILSDDDVAPTPALATTSAAPPPLDSEGQAKVSPQVAAAPFANVDILSDDDGDDNAKPNDVQTPVQPQKQDLLAGTLPAQASQAPPVEASATSVANSATPPPESSSEVGKNGLRSVVVASLDLVDSEEEGDKPTVGKELKSAEPVADVPMPPSSQKPSPQIDDDSEDDMIAPAVPPKAVQPIVSTASKQSTPDDSDDDEMLAVSEAQSAPAATGSPKKRTQPPQAVQPPAKKVKDVQNEPKEVKEKKLTKEDMESKVLQYMQQQNRPYNAQNVFDNLHGSVPKGQVQQFLDALACSGQLLVKEFGKSKVYLVTQSSIAGGKDAAEDDTASLQAELDTSASKVQEMKNVVEEIKKEIASLRSHRNVVEEVASLSREAPALESRVAELRAAAEESAKESKDAACDLTEQEINDIEARCREVHAEWRRRKRLCMEIVHRFSEMAGMKVPKLIEKYGIETDEECNQPFPECMM